MSLFIKTYVNNNDKSAAFGKTYGKVVHFGTLGIDEIAEKIQEKCTVHKADIQAVLTALQGVVSEGLQNGMRVRLPGIGTFKMGVRSSGVVNAADFSLAKNILGTRVLFQPEKSKDNTNHKYTNPLTRGTRFKLFNYTELPSEDSGSGSTTGGSGSDSGSTTGGSQDDPIENRP